MLNAALAPTGSRLVLVEDDQDVRKSLTLMLRGRGFSLDVFDSAMQLLAAGYLPYADCFLIDYKMPKVDGIALIKTLRQQGLTTPAILVTGFFSDNLCQMAEHAGFQATLEKPMRADLLIGQINTLIADYPRRLDSAC